eukprot:PITA_13809
MEVLVEGNKWQPATGTFPVAHYQQPSHAGKASHRALAALSVEHGPLMSLRLGSAVTLVVSSAEMAREFLKTHDLLFLDKSPSAAAKHLSFNCADIVFSPHRAYWTQMRKLCALELLSSRRLDYFRSIREDEVTAMIRSIINSDAHKGSCPLNINQTTSSLATAILCRMAFSLNLWVKKLHSTQDHLLEKVIEEHVAQNGANNTHDLVDALLAASADKDSEFQISRDGIKGVLFDMLLGALDTTPTMIEWAMSEALRNPTVMKKLQDELERVVGLERMVGESDLPQLVYLQAMVKETLRLHPAGPFLNRRLTAKSCNVMGYDIPHNTCVIFNLWAIGRNPNTWEDAECFKPERFIERVGSETDANGDQNFGWLPFGAGRRRCPGQQLATLLVELGVAQLLHCFNWRIPLDDMNGANQELDMTERFNGLTLPKVHELRAIPTPRLNALPT